MGSVLIIITFVRVLRNIEPNKYLPSIWPFTNVIILIICQIMCLWLSLYDQYLLLFILMNGFYFGLSASKMIVSTMSHHPQEIPCKEALVYLTGITLSLLVPPLEAYILIFLMIYILMYYYRYFGSIITQLMEVLKIGF